jgi:hypothetical protein
MMWPNENPLTPDSLAADGIQGADAKTLGPCEAKHSPQPCGARFLALSAMDAAQAQLDRYALATDDPEPGVVEAADLLDAARAALAGTP